MKTDIKKFLEFKKSLDSHAVQRTSYFHIFADCQFHKPLRGEAPTSLGNPIPYTNEDSITHYKVGSGLERNVEVRRCE